MGQALMAGQAARQQTIKMQAARDAADIDKKYKQAQIDNLGVGQNPGDVKEYEFAKANGYSGTYPEWVTMKGQGSRPSNVQEWEFFKGLTDKDQARYLEMKRNPNWKLGEVNNVPTVVQGGVGGSVQTTPLSTLPQVASAASTVEQAKSSGGALGTTQGNIAGSIQKKGSDATVVKGLVSDARKLLSDSETTGSQVGAGMDALGGAVGISTGGAKNTARLKVIQGGLIANMPRMEGPQSDADRLLYMQAAGQVADSTVPAETRLAALDTIDEIQSRYQERAGAPAAPSGAPKETAAQRAARLGL